MTVQISVPLDEEQKARFDAIAEARQEPLAAVVAEALTDYLDYDTWFRAQVAEGIASVEAGDVHDFDDVEREMRAYMADYIARSEA